MASKVHVNNATRISLNDRFTIMQSVGPSGAQQQSGPVAGAPILRRPRSRSRSRSRSVGRMPPQHHAPVVHQRVQAILPPSPRYSRHYDDVIDARPQRLPRAAVAQSMRARVPIGVQKQRLAMAMARRDPGSYAALRTVRRPLRRLPAATTLRMDQMAARSSRAGAVSALRQRRLNRAIATVNQAQLRRAPAAVGRLSRRDLARSVSKQNLVRQRSRSRSNVNLAERVGRAQSRGRSLSRSRSQSNLRRSNSRQNLNQAQPQPAQRRKLNRDFQQRSRSRSQSRSRQNQKAPSIASRLGVRPGDKSAGNKKNNGAPKSIASRLGKPKGQAALKGVAQGRVSKQQRFGGQPNKVAKKGNQPQKVQGKKGTQLAKGKKLAAVAKKNLKGGKKPSGVQQRLQRPGQKKQQKQPQQQPQGGQAQKKARRGKRGRPAAGPKKPLKKEDLDKELDKYMSTNNN